MDRPALPLGELLCYFYLSLSSGKGQVQVSTPPSLASCTLCLLLCKIPFSCLKRGQKRACNALEEQTSTGSRHSSTRTLSKDLPCCCSAPGSCTLSPLPCSLHSPISSGPGLTSCWICWCHFRPQILPDRLFAGSEAPHASVHTHGDTYHCRQRQRLLLPGAARPRCGEMH